MQAADRCRQGTDTRSAAADHDGQVDKLAPVAASTTLSRTRRSSRVPPRGSSGR